MKKYAYILLILASVSTMATAQIKIGNYSFKDGSEYTGELKGRKPNGKGKTVFKNGDIYEGQYVKGKREGDGTYTFHDGEICGAVVSGPAAWQRYFLFYEQQSL